MRCIRCNREMTPCIDITTGKIEGDSWKCECMPKHLRIGVLGVKGKESDWGMKIIKCVREWYGWQKKKEQIMINGGE